LKHHGGPLLGYNNNIPYKGHVYHVQTEDSGSKRPHVITHLFADGGRIIKTRKTSYAQFVGEDDLPEKVRALMREQHKGMVLSLRDGEFDLIIDPSGAHEAPPVEDEPAPPSVPIALLERAAAAVDDHQFQEEIERISTTDAPARSGGAYSFVGDRDVGPKRAPVPRRMRATRPPNESDAPSEDEAPPAVDVTGPAASPPDPAREAGRGPAPGKPFGAGVSSGRRLDELVALFLSRHH
jgi:hypothetical protein